MQEKEREAKERGIRNAAVVSIVYGSNWPMKLVVDDVRNFYLSSVQGKNRE